MRRGRIYACMYESDIPYCVHVVQQAFSATTFRKAGGAHQNLASSTKFFSTISFLDLKFPLKIPRRAFIKFLSRSSISQIVRPICGPALETKGPSEPIPSEYRGGEVWKTSKYDLVRLGHNASWFLGAFKKRCQMSALPCMLCVACHLIWFDAFNTSSQCPVILKSFAILQSITSCVSLISVIIGRALPRHCTWISSRIGVQCVHSVFHLPTLLKRKYGRRYRD